MNLAFDAIRQMVDAGTHSAAPRSYGTFTQFLNTAPLEVLKQTLRAMIVMRESIADHLRVIEAADSGVGGNLRAAAEAMDLRLAEIDKALFRRTPRTVRESTPEEDAALIARCDPSTFGRFPGRNGAE